MKDKIFLLGFMGSGKSTLGKKLAIKLNVNFLDLDQFIEEQQEQTIQEIFKTKGEDFFREIERDCLKQVIALPDNFIIALGGGTPCFYDNMELINKSGVSIYIKYNKGILAHRLMHSKKNRPLINNKNQEGLLEFIETTLLKREVFYDKSSIILEKNNLKPEDIIDSL